MKQLKRVFGVTLVATLFFCTAASAQFLTRGYGIAFGVVQMPDALRFDGSGNPIFFEDSMYRESGFVPTVGLNMPLQFRLAKISKERSIGLYVNPTLGFFLGKQAKNAYGTAFENYGVPFFLSLPVTLQFMSGNFSSEDSELDRGFAVGVGAESSFYYDRWTIEDHSYYQNNAVDMSGIRPALSLHYRWWTGASNLAELQMLISRFGYERDGQSNGSITARLSLNLYLNY